MTINGLPVWVVALVACGVFLAGLVDAIAGGGGLISLPTYLATGIASHDALGTNKLSSCIGTAISAFRYARRGYINWALGLPAAALALLGAWTGTRLQLRMEETILRWVLLAVLPVVAFFVLRQRQLPEQPRQMGRGKQRAIVWCAALALGAYDGFYGPGTGTFLLLIFTGWAGLDMRTASGTVKLVNLSSNVAALATSLAAGRVLPGVGLIAAAASVAGHYLGAGLAIRRGTRIVRPVVLLVLALLAGKVLFELL